MALRFPKVHHQGFSSLSLGSGTFGGATIYTDQLQGFCIIRPAAFSELRKVIVSMSVQNGSTTTDMRCRLRLFAVSANGNSTVPTAVSLSQSSTISSSGGVAMGFESTFTPKVASLLDKKGEWVTIAGNSTVFSSIVQIEFDRFDAGSQQLFNALDANFADDEYVAYAIGIEVETGGPPVGRSIQWTTTQAPSISNKSVTYIPMWMSRDSTGSGFNSFDSAAAQPVRGGIRWKYHAEDWDGITEINLIVAWGNKGNTSGIRWRLQRVTGIDTTADIFEEDIPGDSSGSHGWWRSQDFKSELVDDRDYTCECRHLASSIGNTRNGTHTAWIEIVQEDFSLTQTFHTCQQNSNRNRETAPTYPIPNAALESGLFDPLWYEDYPDSFISRRIIFSGFAHNTNLDFKNSVLFNSVLNESVSFLSPTGGKSVTTVEIDDVISSTPDNEFGWKWRETPMGPGTGNIDPIALAGQRHFYLTVESDTQTDENTNNAHHHASFAYSFFVPESDILPRGPLFDVGAFNPEGCAATSAGLGDRPPLLVITNGSTIPKKFNPNAFGTSDEITDAGIPTPFEGETPNTVTADAANSPDGGLSLGTYKYRYTFRNCCTNKESDPNPEDIEVDTTGQSPAAKVTLGFAGVRIPSDEQICEICIYRTIEGGEFPAMAKVGCFDPDETDTFEDTLDDSALDFDNEGLSILNAPMPCAPIVVDFRNRLFAMGDIPQLLPAGTVSVVNGSDIVTGDDDVLWDRCLEGKRIRVGSDCRDYEIDLVLPPEFGTSPPIARLKLTEEYEGETDNQLSYTICGYPSRIYISEPFEPEYWPIANFLDVEPGDGDRIMGAVSNFDSLVICKRRKSYILKFREQPAIEVVVPARISSDIGCIGPRTFAQVESGSVWLSDRGLARFDGRSVQHVPESDMMNNLFIDPENPNYVRRDANGRVIDAVGVFYPKREQYLLLLPTVKTDRGCSLMLVWDTSLGNITLLEFCQEFQAMEVAKDSDGNERVYLGDTNGFVWIYDVGDTDGAGFPNATGTVRGAVGSAGLTDDGVSFLDDSTAAFLVGGVPSIADLSGVAGLTPSFDGDDLGLAGACLYTRRAGAELDEPWTVRTIFASTSTRLFVTPGWGPDTPNEGDDYMIGAIRFDCIFKPQNLQTDNTQKRNWKQIVVHEAEDFASQLRVELRPDFQQSDDDELTIIDPVTGVTGLGRVFRMDYERGRQTKPVGRRIYDFMSVRLRNFAPEEPIRLINHILGVEPRGD